MVNYISTRNTNIKVSSSKAILDGQAPDGGLYIPDDLNSIKLDYHDVIKYDFSGMAKVIWNIFFPDYGEDLINDLVERSYKNKFSNEQTTPLEKVGKDYVLELYYGPTAAFKDVALSALPNLLTTAKDLNSFQDEILILTATSGDTGSAALYGFSDVPGTSIIVFFPEGGISETQRLQMVTASGANTYACAIKGNFDDAQSGVKEIFNNIPKPVSGVSLSSANSINIGRLVPQIVYYFSAYRQLLEGGYISDGSKVNFIVPTGNFGDMMAGYFALQMGLPINKLICASNNNDVLTEFFETGHYNRKRPFHKTTSPSMDILVSSNLERLLYYICGPENTANYMKLLAETGEYQINTDELTQLKKIFVGISASDKEGSECIGNIYKNENYLMDTHTAIAWSCLEQFKDKAWAYSNNNEETEYANVVLSTASPYKFCHEVLTAIGAELKFSDESNMQKCQEITGVPIPSGLADVFSKEIRHSKVISTEDMQQYVIDCAKTIGE